MQKLFSGRENFRWVEQADGSYWYEFDAKAAAKQALKARNRLAKEKAAEGFTVSKFALGDQLLSFGGIGTQYPHIEVWTKCYGLNWKEAQKYI